MYASIPKNSASISELFRWFARASSAVLFVSWAVLLALELTGEGRATTEGAAQAAALAIVFVGYGLAWRNELVGAVVAIVGAAVFFVSFAVSFQGLPSLAVAWFAVPAVLFLMAWYYDKRHPSLQ